MFYDEKSSIDERMDAIDKIASQKGAEQIICFSTKEIAVYDFFRHHHLIKHLLCVELVNPYNNDGIGKMFYCKGPKLFIWIMCKCCMHVEKTDQMAIDNRKQFRRFIGRDESQ